MPQPSLLRTADRASKLMKAMGNARRLAVLCHLNEREHSVNELCRLVGLSQSALSQHLAKLRRDRLVTTRRSAQTVYYSLASPEVAPLLRALSDIFAPERRAAVPQAAETRRERAGHAEGEGKGADWHKQEV